MNLYERSLYMPNKTMDDLIYETDLHLPVATEKNGLPCLVFPSLEKTGVVRHLVSTKLGGVSTGFLSSLNFSLTHGDAPENLTENFKRVARALEVPYESITLTDQTHTANVRVIREEDKGKGWAKERDYHDIDALVTNFPGICLSVYVADCVPILLVDPKKRAIGAAHSGWRGTVARVGEKTLAVMEREYGCEPSDVIATIGPSIGLSCYEVSEDVIMEIKKAFRSAVWPSLFYKKENGRYQLDLRKACEVTLLEAGVCPEHITVSDLCTACNKDLLFSHRGSAGKRGDFGAFLYLE